MIEQVRGDRIEARPQREVHTLCLALLVAAAVNVLIPAILFANREFFGAISFRHRLPVVAAVFVEYLIAFLVIRLHENRGFAGGYAIAMSAVVTLGSVALSWTVVRFAGLGAVAVPSRILVVGTFALAVLSNAVFLAASVRYARAIHPRLHLGGFITGVVACFVLLFLYLHILP